MADVTRRSAGRGDWTGLDEFALSRAGPEGRRVCWFVLSCEDGLLNECTYVESPRPVARKPEGATTLAIHPNLHLASTMAWEMETVLWRRGVSWLFLVLQVYGRESGAILPCQGGAGGAHREEAKAPVTCACCGGRRWRAFATVATFALRGCAYCGFVHTELPPDFDTRPLYSGAYFFGGGFDKSALIPESRNPRPELVARRRYWLQLLAARVERRELLDVGCGAGALLDVAARQGWEAWGQDIAATGVAEARRHGHNVCLGEIIDCGWTEASFAAATLVEVVEHLPDPRGVVGEVLRLLRPGGVLLVTTGDVGSFRARIQRGRWGYIRPPGHCSYFTQTALRLMLTRVGFRTVIFAPTYNRAHPSLPGRVAAKKGPERWMATALRTVTRSELCALAIA